MERVFILKGLTCPNCSAKIEKEVGELSGVENSVLNLLQQSLKVNVAESYGDNLLKNIEQIVHSHESDVEVSEKTKAQGDNICFSLKGLDCPNCATLIEREATGLEFVDKASLNLMQQTMHVWVKPGYDGAVQTVIAELVHKYEPDVEVSIKEAKVRNKITAEESDKQRKLKLGIGAVIYVGVMALTAFTEVEFYLQLGLLVIAYIILGGDVVWKALKNISQGRVFDENFLMSLSTVGAFAIGEYPEAVAVMMFYQIGEYFQDRAVNNSRKSISALLDIRPDAAVVRRDGKLLTVAPEAVAVGETIMVKAGERIPLDGVVIRGTSMIDTRALTGESVPRTASAGDTVLAGCINQNSVLDITVSKLYSESTAAKIIDLVENAASHKAPAENFITTFSRYYTPVVVILAVLLAFIPPLLFGGEWTEWVRRSFVFLVVSCPCALVISIPLTFFGGIGAASKKGILVKGGNYLEALNSVDTMIFDKTGTLTKGVFKVTEINAANGFTAPEVLEYAAQAERMSNHPIARSIMQAYGKVPAESATGEYSELAGQGLSLKINNQQILVGNSQLMEDNDISFTESKTPGTKIYVAVDKRFAGSIIVADELKEDSAAAIKRLKAIGITRTVMLTGDSEEIAAMTAAKLGITEYAAELLPDQKVAKLVALSDNNAGGSRKIAFVGDGINDAPVLARADVGIAMGGIGSDAAIEAADIVIMNDEPSKLADAVQVAKATKRIVMQNIIFAVGIKFALLALGAVGLVGMWEAVFGDVGVMVIAVLNALRILKV